MLGTQRASLDIEELYAGAFLQLLLGATMA
jgi:hypothetical protein